MNGKPLNKNEHITANNQNFFEIEYTYKTKTYSIYGNEITKLLDYVENVNAIIDIEYQKKSQIYKWISAVDDNNICFLDIIKKSSGPLGDFYKHYNIDIHSKHIPDIKGNRILLTNFNLDEYIIEPSSIIRL